MLAAPEGGNSAAPKPSKPARPAPAPVAPDPYTETAPQAPLTVAAAASRNTNDALQQLLSTPAPVKSDQTLGGLITDGEPSYYDGIVADARAQLEEALSAKPETAAVAAGFRTGGGAMAAQAGRAADQQGGVDSAQDVLDNALRLQREHAIGADRPKQHGVPTDAGRFGHLNDLQRAAITFNKMLTDAVSKDKRLQDEYGANAKAELDPFRADSTERQTYDAAVEKIFGEGRGSATYAPETVALLRQIGYTDTSGDLDDFLSKDAGIAGRTLKFLGQDRSEGREESMNQSRRDRIDLGDTLAQAALTLENKLAETNQLAGDTVTSARVERNQDLGFLGGRQNRPQLGYGPAADQAGEMTVDGYFQQAFDLLGRKDSDREAILTSLNADLTPEEVQAFLDYANTRTSQAEQFELPIGAGGEGVKYRTPEEFRKLLGLKGGS